MPQGSRKDEVTVSRMMLASVWISGARVCSGNAGVCPEAFGGPVWTGGPDGYPALLELDELEELDELLLELEELELEELAELLELDELLLELPPPLPPQPTSKKPLNDPTTKCQVNDLNLFILPSFLVVAPIAPPISFSADGLVSVHTRQFLTGYKTLPGFGPRAPLLIKANSAKRCAKTWMLVQKAISECHFVGVSAIGQTVPAGFGL